MRQIAKSIPVRVKKQDHQQVEKVLSTKNVAQKNQSSIGRIAFTIKVDLLIWIMALDKMKKKLKDVKKIQKDNIKAPKGAFMLSKSTVTGQ